jgi:hypothetical protein
MTHLTDDDLVLHYYGELEGEAAGRVTTHLQACGTCRAAFTKLQRVFAMVDTVPEPALGDGFERIVWARLQPRLEQARHGWASWFILSPARLAWLAAIVVLVGAAFFAGRLSKPEVPSAATTASTATTAAAARDLRERVLLSDLSEHLDRSQLMLVDFVSAESERDVDLPVERTRAEQLLSANRLYRQTAVDTGNLALAQVLDDLEQVLVDIAASPDRVSAEDLAAVQHRIDDKGLLLKVRVLSSEVQKRQLTKRRAFTS